MEEKDKLFKLVNQLKNIFIYHSETLQYNEKLQSKVNKLMDELANLTGVFNVGIKNETANIINELTIIDKKTQERVELVNIESMAQRVKSINNKNNIFSCLKTLALSNKIAHIYDGNVKKCKNRFISYYNDTFPNQKIKDINFMESLNINFSNLIGKNKYNCDMISDNEFDKIFNLLSNDSKINKGAKISVLKKLNIKFNIKDDKDIDNKFNDLCQNKEYIVSSYLIKKFKEGQDFVKFENKMFAIKDSYISMIGQLLCKNQLKNTPYQLIKTPNATPGFEYMLIIDDKDLSYYIEVHMPNFIATKLIEKYGMKYSEERSFEKLGASAIYYRDKKEIQEILKAIKNNDLTENARARIISRDYRYDNKSGNPKTDQGIDENITEITNDETASEYEFVTKEIAKDLSIFEKFLMTNPSYKKLVENLRLNYFNENVPIQEINRLNNQKYNYIYDNFDYDYKEKFIEYAFNELKHGDFFDKKLYDRIYDIISYYNIDNISKMLINLNEIKYDFIKNNKQEINEELYKYKNLENIYKDDFNKKTHKMNDCIDKYLDDTLDKIDIVKSNKKNR